MSTILGNVSASPVLATGTNTRISRCMVAIGASGAATVDADPGWTVTKNTTGVYDVTFPTSCSTARAILKCGVALSPALTVVNAVATAVSYTAGTATVKTLLNDAAAQPASGDYIWLELISSGGMSA